MTLVPAICVTKKPGPEEQQALMVLHASHDSHVQTASTVRVGAVAGKVVVLVVVGRGRW